MATTDKHNQLVYVMGQLDFSWPQPASSTNTVHSGSSAGALIKLWLPYPPITINLRFQSAANCPFIPTSTNEKKWLQHQLKLIEEFDLFGSSSTPSGPCLLTEQQLNYFKKTNPAHPNATLFIHGFNVPYGEYAHELHSFPINPDKMDALFPTVEQVKYVTGTNKYPAKASLQKDFRLRFNQKKATIYRNAQHVTTTFGFAADSLNLFNDKLNGTGSHNWWLHMEYNLNKAAGFNGFDYYYNPQQPFYTRIINIAWSGDPQSAIDYMAIEPVAAITAKSLVDIIKQLHRNGIAINIIAHSGGSIVAIKALNELGIDSQYSNAVNNLFLWQAAVPNYALSPIANQMDQSSNQFWHTQHAYLTCKRIHILYSRHDNVLGPIPFQQDGKPDAKLTHKLFDRDSRKDLAALAVVIRVIDRIDQSTGVPNSINSVYYAAQLFNIPLSILLSSQSSREKAYLTWSKRHSNNHYLKFAANLSAQKDSIKRQFPHAFNNLSLVIGLYYAILHDSLFIFFKNPDNQEKIMNMLFKLNPKEASVILNTLTETMNSEFTLEDHKIVLSKINALAEKNLHFLYLQKLAHGLFHSNSEYVNDQISHKSELLVEKIHELLLQTVGEFYHPTLLLTKKINGWLEHIAHNESSAPTLHRAQQVGEEMAALIISIFNTPNVIAYHALGYNGPLRGKLDKSMQKLINQKKVVLLDQTDYLFQHSGMKIPSTEVFDRSFITQIIHAQGFQLGRWPRN